MEWLEGGGPREAQDDVAPEGTPVNGRAIPMVDDRLDSRDLFATGRLITIAHGDQIYQLRLTAQNKLILTK